MGLVTRCPACGTGFRVGADQLKALHGTVRCGLCDTVFNAFDSLVTLPDSPEVTPAARPPIAPEAPAGAKHPEEDAPRQAGSAPVDPRSFGVAGGQPAPSEEVRLGPPLPEEVPPGGEAPREEGALAGGAVAHPGQGELALGYAASVGARRFGAWRRGALVLAVLFVIQLGYVLRVEIVGALPALRPWLDDVCALIGCTLPLPQRVEQWNIESSDLQSDPAQPSLMVLTAVLRNRAAFAQPYPALELTLTDARDQALARRVFAAPEYLPQGPDSRAGLGANGEVVVRLTMETGDLNAAGYRLYLFYP
ncbi:MAG TPA: zinc-ribbon and DUF3426 domain-containing protein [Burkholderiales bacterium]|nr:zinc-ribbon and DUF3426 domain-containing protein [Burkholderiales bacterium]